MAEKTQMLNCEGAIKLAIIEEMRRDKNVVLWGEDIQWREAKEMFEEFGGNRIRNTPIVEVAFIEATVGAAITGLRPIAFTSAGFVPIFFDGVYGKVGNYWQLHNYKGPVPIVIHATILSEHGMSTDHQMSPEGILQHSPGLKIVMPSTPYDAKGLLKAAIRDDFPVVFLPHRNLSNIKEEVPTDDYIVPLGKAAVRREGNDVTIVSYSYTMIKASVAAEELSKEKISAELIDLRCIVPLDVETIVMSLKKTGRLLIVHEAMERGGAAGEIAFRVIEKAPDLVKGLKAPMRRLAAKNIATGPTAELEKAVLPQVPDIVKAVKEMV